MQTIFYYNPADFSTQGREKLMKKELVFHGAATAPVTPFGSIGIDCAAAAKMMEFPLTNGIDALVDAERPAHRQHFGHGKTLAY